MFGHSSPEEQQRRRAAAEQKRQEAISAQKSRDAVKEQQRSGLRIPITFMGAAGITVRGIGNEPPGRGDLYYDNGRLVLWMLSGSVAEFADNEIVDLMVNNHQVDYGPGVVPVSSGFTNTVETSLAVALMSGTSAWTDFSIAFTDNRELALRCSTPCDRLLTQIGLIVNHNANEAAQLAPAEAPSAGYPSDAPGPHFCSNCGAPAVGGAHFCAQCGAALN